MTPPFYSHNLVSNPICIEFVLTSFKFHEMLCGNVKNMPNYDQLPDFIIYQLSFLINGPADYE